MSSAAQLVWDTRREGKGALLFSFSSWCFMVGRHQTPVKTLSLFALLCTSHGTESLVFLYTAYCLSYSKQQK